MLRWNKMINLTRIERMEEVVDRHYAESLFLGSNLPAGPITIGDVGSGAGFPGLPIAVLRPESRITNRVAPTQGCVPERGRSGIAECGRYFETCRGCRGKVRLDCI